MNLLIFVVMVVGSFLVVRIAGVIFELTGLEWHLAKFQALSCFTTTGYTTSEAELITRYPRRRRIASILMILGHAGLVALIASFANLVGGNEGEPIFLPAVRVLAAATAVYVCYLLFMKTIIAVKITDLLRKFIAKRSVVEPCRQLLIATPGYDITGIKVTKKYPVANQTLQQAGFASQGIIILALERGTTSIVTPTPEQKILPGDTLICFGKFGQVKQQVCGQKMQ